MLVTLIIVVQVQPGMARELFAAGFVSCWAELEEGMREALVRSLEAALASPSIPAEIVTTLLNLAEFMEHNEKKLPLDTRQAILFLICIESFLLEVVRTLINLAEVAEHNEKKVPLDTRQVLFLSLY